MTTQTQQILAKLRESLKKDFHNLYQREFTTDWREQRVVRDIEIEIMNLNNVLQLISQYEK